MQTNTNKYILYKYFTHIIIYHLCLETYLLYNSRLFINKVFFPTVLNFKILHNYFELLFLSSNYMFLSTWCKIFVQLINTSFIMRKNTIVTNILTFTEGINFMDYFVCSYNNIYLHVAPSRVAQSFLLGKIATIFIKLKGSSEIQLLVQLTKLLNDWKNYFCFCNSNKIFCLLDYLVYLKFKRWNMRRHSIWHKQNSISQYFYLRINK